MRRGLSVLLYIAAGWIGGSEVVAAFVLPSLGGGGYLGMAAALLIFFMLLGLGAWASPGRRLWETGLVLLLSVGWGLFAVAMSAVMMVMPDTQVLVPEATRATLGAFAAASWPAALLNSGLLLILGIIAIRRGAEDLPADRAAPAAEPAGAAETPEPARQG